MSARRRTCRNEHGSPRPSHSRVALVQRRAVFVSTVAIYDARDATPILRTLHSGPAASAGGCSTGPRDAPRWTG